MQSEEKSLLFFQVCTSASIEADGHARNKGWRLDNNPPPIKQKDYRERSYVDLLLSPSEEDLKQWPYSYEFRLGVSLSSCGNLNMKSRIRNIYSKPFSFSFGYRTYFICFGYLVDWAYLSTEDCIAVIDHGKKRKL